MRRSRTKYRKSSKLYIFGISLLVVFLAVIVCNILLNRQKTRVSAAAADYFTQKVSVDNLLFLPPHYIFLKNLSLSDNQEKSPVRILTLPLVTVKFSLFNLIRYGKIFITDVVLYDPNAEYRELRDFVKGNSQQIWKFFLDLPRQDIKIMVKGFRVNLAEENGGPGHISSNLYLKIKNDGLSGYGSASRNLENKFPGIPLEFIFKGSLNANGVSFDNLEIMRENFYAKFWGDVHSCVLRLNGFTFVNTAFKERAYYEPLLTVKERMDNFLRGFPGPPEDREIPKVDFFLLDLESQIVFNFPDVDIQKLKFSLNNNPMSLTGRIKFYWDKPILLDLTYSTTFSQLKNWNGESPNLKNINVTLKGAVQDRIFKGDSRIRLDFLKRKSGSLPIEEFKAGLDGLSLSFVNFPRLTAGVSNSDIFCRTDSADYNIVLKNLGLSADLSHPVQRFVEFDSGFYGGQARGRVWFDLSQYPFRITSLLRIKNAEAENLKNLLEHFSKIHGKLSGQMRFRNFPELSLKGSLSVNNGYIENFEFLKWLAGFFDLPDLRKIEFARTFANFSVDPSGAGLNNLQLTSSELVLGGGFRLDASDMVNSKLALTCSRNLLGRSVKFRPLMRLVEKDVAALTLEFRLSGNLNKMNFLWLESDFKKRLRQAIPNFMEASVEKKIEQSLAPLEGK